MKPRIPMTPGEVPRQHVYLVVDLPERPPGFVGQLDWHVPMPERDHPKGPPRNVEYVGSVEWAWGPHHTRVDSYYLNPRGRHWILWICSRDENAWKEKWNWTPYGYGPRRGIQPKVAAACLLQDAWQAETDKGFLDRFTIVDEAGLLSVEEFKEIGRRVWPPPQKIG